VIIEDLVVEEAAGKANRYAYHITLKEYREPKPTKEEPPPEQKAEEKQSEIDDIRGKILDADGNPSKDVTVLINGPSGETRVKTNDEGIYEALDLPEGKYEITVEM